MIDTTRMDAKIFSALGGPAQLKDSFGSFVKTINGIFDYEYIEVGGSESRAPMFTCATIDLPTDVHNYQLDIEGQGSDYKVITPQPDGTGVTQLLLEKIP